MAGTMPGKNGGTLKRPAKGESGNPKGRPRKLPDLDVLGAEIFGADPETGGSKMKEVVEALFAKAKKGDVKAMAYIMDRFYGKPTQRSEVTGANGEPITGTFIVKVKDTNNGNDEGKNDG